jgi:hypothetical protein
VSKVTIQVEGDAFREMIAMVDPALERAFREEVEPIYEHAVESWPEDTGLSKESFKLAYGREGGHPYVGIFNLVPYSAKTVPVKGGTPSVVTLLEEPLDRAADRILVRIGGLL